MKFKSALVTGGAGFIGSHVLLDWVPKYPDIQFVNLDKLGYAGNLENLKAIESLPNYQFVKGDITDENLVNSLFDQHEFDLVVHLAAESHVDRSIKDPLSFVVSNVLGTVRLLQAALKRHRSGQKITFHHVSTDEVYGSLGAEGFFTEETAYDPRSPYSASKASSDHFVRAYYHTYGLPVLISNCSNNYGPYQFPEKLIPLMINNIKHEKELPVYGDGSNVRDWLWVRDHVSAIETILQNGKLGETYVVGGNNELKNLELVEMLCDLMDQELGRPPGSSRKLIRFVTDRPGHDHRYAIDSSRLMNELNWEPSLMPEAGMLKTVQWYLKNSDWLDRVTSGTYQNYYEGMYADR